MGLIFSGGNLLVANGRLAQTTSCCCGLPPEPCWCSDLCSYTTSIVSPADFAASIPLPGARCPAPGPGPGLNLNFMCMPDSGIESLLLDGFHQSNYQNQCRRKAWHGFFYWEAAWSSEQSKDYLTVSTYLTSSLRIFCSQGLSSSPSWLYEAVFAGYIDIGNVQNRIEYTKTQTGVLASNCEKNLLRQCAGDQNTFTNSFLQTPIQFSLGASSVSLPGTQSALDINRVYNPTDPSVDLSLLSQCEQLLLDSLEAAPPIVGSVTSIPSCRTACCCQDGKITEIDAGQACDGALSSVSNKPDQQEPCAATGVKISYCGRELIADFVDGVAAGYEDFLSDGAGFFSCPIDGDTYPFTRLNMNCQVSTISACNKCYYSVNVIVEWFSEQAGMDTKTIRVQTGSHLDDTVVYFVSEECESTPLWKRTVELTNVDELPDCVDCYETVPVVEFLYAP